MADEMNLGKPEGACERSLKKKTKTKALSFHVPTLHRVTGAVRNVVAWPAAGYFLLPVHPDGGLLGSEEAEKSQSANSLHDSHS